MRSLIPDSETKTCENLKKNRLQLTCTAQPLDALS